MAKIKIGLIGCGRWGKNILRDLLSLDVDVYVADHHEVNLEHASVSGAKLVFSDWSDMPSDVDGYVVAVPTIKHHDVLKQLSKTNMPVFVEKPMVPNLSQAEDIQRLMGDRLFVMHKWRYHPGIQKLAELRTSEKYGKLLNFSTSRLQWRQPHSDVDAFWILTPHDISIILHVLGNIPPVKSVQAEHIAGNIHDLKAFLVGDVSVSIHISDTYPSTVRTNVAKFENAVVSLNDPLSDHLSVLFLDQNGNPTNKTEKIDISTEYPLFREIKAFIGHLENGTPLKSSVADEILMMKTLDRLRQEAFKA